MQSWRGYDRRRSSVAKGIVGRQIERPRRGTPLYFCMGYQRFRYKSIFETDENGLPGIDGSAIMIVPLVLSLLHTQSQQTSQEPEAGCVGRLSLVSRVS